MNDDPVRWKDGESDAPDLVRRLLRVVPATPPPSDANLALARAKIEAIATSSLKATLFSAKGVLALGIGTLGAIVVVGGMLVSAPRVVPRPLTSVDTAPAPSAAQESIVTASAESAPVASAAVTPQGPASASAGTKRPPAPTGDELRAESLALERARASLDARPAQTLEDLREQSARFPRGQLGSDREYLAISALTKLGRRDEAKARARTFLLHHASSPYATAVRRVLVEVPAPANAP